MSPSPIADMVAARVATRDERGIPIPRYMLVVAIDANSLDELRSAIDQFALDMETEWAGREVIDSTDGRTSVRLMVTNEEQSPESYDELLRAWSDRRRKSQDSKPGGSE